MMKLHLPRKEVKQFHNFRCGEVFCIGPTTYDICCALCGQKVMYHNFPHHFRLEHLSKQDEQSDEEEAEKAANEIIKIRETSNTEVENQASKLAVSKLEADPIGPEKFTENANVDLAKMLLFYYESDEVNGLEKEYIADDTDAVLSNSVKSNSEIMAAEENTSDMVSTEPQAAKMKTGKKLQRDEYDCRVIPPNSTCSASISKENTTNINNSYKDSYQIEVCQEIYNSDGEGADINGKDIDVFEKQFKFACDECERYYKSKSGLHYHKRSKHGKDAKRKPSDTTSENNNKQQKVYKCTDCNQAFFKECALKTHRWKHTGILCDICGKSFSQSGNMLRHRVRHSGIKTFKCSECNASFYTKKELISHNICHTGRMPVICDVCGRPCRDRGVLTAHMRRHTGERPAKCDVCGKSFYSVHDRNVHAVAHSSARPFVCDICGATFQRKKALRVHKLLHSDERKYVCKICGKAFAQSGGLNAHLRIHDAASVKTNIEKTKCAKISDINDKESPTIGALDNGQNDMDVAISSTTGEVIISMDAEEIHVIPWSPV